jgi:lincosamide nucleotidyltransferase A/C/D/E
MSQEQVLELMGLFAAHSVDPWLVGGWGVDALLGVQTRPHKDLDLLIRLEDVAKTMQLLEEHGFSFAYTWPESRWLEGVKPLPTAFVMMHPDGREVDVHTIRFDAHGTPHPEWQTDWDLAAIDLTAGSIGGFDVRCTTADRQLRDHATYEMPPDHARDMELLRRAFRYERQAERP